MKSVFGEPGGIAYFDTVALDSLFADSYVIFMEGSDGTNNSTCCIGT